MKIDELPYYYDEHLKRLLTQFLAIFTSMKVRSGKTNELEERFIDVQVKSGSSDRVVAAIMAHNTQNAPIRLPTIAGHIQNVSLAPNMRKGLHTERQKSFMPEGGVFPTDLKTLKQLMPNPYNCEFELNVFTSSQDQQFEIMEQILMLFDPLLELFTSDEIFDWTRLTAVELVNMSMDDALPTTDRRLNKVTYNFTAPMWMNPPADMRSNYVGEIKLRVGAVNNATKNAFDGLAQLDQDGVEYDTIAKLSDLNISFDESSNS